MTLNYGMMMERYPNLMEEVDGMNPRCKISSLLDKKHVGLCLKNKNRNT
jgi:hypothetical protein